jgi:hypothetical protein
MTADKQLKARRRAEQIRSDQSRASRAKKTLDRRGPEQSKVK